MFVIISFGFWSSCLIVYIHLLCINTQWITTTLFSLWSSLSGVILLCWYNTNTVLRFVWFIFIFIQLIIKFIYIYPVSTHSNKQRIHLTSLASYHLATAKRRDCIRGQPIVVRETVTLIYFVCFSHIRQFTTVTNQCSLLSQTWTCLVEVLQLLVSLVEFPWYSTCILCSSYVCILTGNKVLQFWFITRLTSQWLLLSRVSALYCYYENMILRFVIFRLILIILFDSLYQFTLHKHTASNNNNILFVINIITGEFTMLIQHKYGFKVCVISFNFYSAHYKVYIHLLCINTQRQTTASFDITNVISSSNRQMPRLYQVSADCCEVDRNYDIIRLLQPYQTIHYCNQSMFVIVPDLNIFGRSITIIGLTWISTLVKVFYIIF